MLFIEFLKVTRDCIDFLLDIYGERMSLEVKQDMISFNCSLYHMSKRIEINPSSQNSLSMMEFTINMIENINEVANYFERFEQSSEYKTFTEKANQVKYSLQNQLQGEMYG